MKNLRILLVILCWPLVSLSQTSYYYISGTLSTPANWNTARDGSGTALTNFTTNNRTYVIQNGQTVANSAAWLISGTTSKLQIENNASLTATTAITLSGNTTFQIDNGGTYIHNNASTLSSTIFAGTESFGVTSTFQINNWQSSNTSLTGNLTASAAPGDGNNYYYGNLIINWAGGVTWNQGWISTNIYLAASNLTVTSSFTGTFLFTSSNARPYVYVYGSFSMGSTSGAVDFCSNGATNYPRLYVNGNVNHTSGTITTSGNNAYGSIYTYGPLTSTWTFSGGTRNYLAYYIVPGKTVTLGNNFNLNAQPTVLNDLTIDGTLNALNYIISYAATSSYAVVIISATGTITTTNTNGLAGSTVTTINPTNTVNTYLQTGSTVEYRAAGGTQTITTPSNANFLFDATVSNLPNYENLTINGTGTKQINNAVTVSKVLTLSGGNPGSTNLFNLNNNVLTIAATGSVAGYNSSNYIVPGSGAGRLRHNGVTSTNYNSTKYFPIGTASCYLPAAANPTATSDFTANVFTGATTNGLSGGTAWTATQKKGMVDAVWNVERKSDRIAISGTAVNTFRWDNCYSSLEGMDFAAAANSSIGIWRWVSGTNWSLSSANFTSDNSDAGGFNTSFNNTSATYPGPYIVAVITSPLDIFNIALKASVKNKNDVLLDWAALGVISLIKSFDVERSFDKVHFAKISSLINNGNSNYSITDFGLNYRQVYYRIKAIDNSGSYKYSNTVSVYTGSGTGVSLLTNPVNTRVVLLHPPSANAQYRVINVEGKIVSGGNIPANSNISYLDVGNLKSGVYILQYIDNGEINSFKLIKQ